jgi:hypothetical protein
MKTARLTRLQTTDKVPLDRAWKQLGLLCELLGVVLAEVCLSYWVLVKSQDIIDGLQFGDCYQTDLGRR